MALEDIKKAVLAEAKSEADKIRSEGKVQVDELKKNWEKKLDAKVIDIIAIANKKAQTKIQQTTFKLKATTQTEILKKKQDTIGKVYSKVVSKLTEMPDQDYIDLMEKLIKLLPDLSGEIISVKGKESLLGKALSKSGKKVKIVKDSISGNGGFVFISDKVEIDNTFKALVENAKDKTALAVAEILFSSDNK